MDKQRLSTALNDARYDERFKMPGYTGHVNGLMEVYASTPVHAARKAFYRNGSEMDPTAVPFIAEGARDQCNKDGGMQKRCVPELLWPETAYGGAGAVRKGENGSSLRMGDPRFLMKVSHYKDVYVHPELQASLWKPAPMIKDHTFGNLVDLSPVERQALYDKMVTKLGQVYLQHVEDNLRIKFFSKVKVAGNVNGYRFQKLFTYYDTKETGVIEIHNFRKAMISIGLQLPEEVEVCLFAKFDVDNNGTLDYIEFCKYFLEEEYQQLAFSNLKGKAGREASLSNSQQLKVDEIHKALKDRFRQLTGPRASAQIKDVFRTIDIAGTGTVTKGEFEQGMKKMAIAFSPEELQLIFDMVDTPNGVDYKAFCDQFCVTFMETIGGRSSYANATGRYFVESA